MNEDASYKKLIIWQKADLFAREIYKVTVFFPKDEIYGLTSQIRRAVLSVVLNIIEGYARNNKKEFKNFLRIAYASLVEVEYLLEFSSVRGYITKEKYFFLNGLRDECGKILWKFMLSQK
ncbi:four helix bundle protein [Candidatus Shapirobacteria bacterium CG08_land_8_20_14_0_20_39_18]|uniref:Four helix bundle protein n=1 Tax=Candidatus Shapirobacteria bacterium CG08_land_8_20_14_0_20_39_18 TaxID=1974883 RepID=A0A2M6XCW5_9BACT|nr:MAG: four helix bundle protein [Candidatus Shapirobacteria bacterium CG08_land_8_20_14_0_20_39_18]PIY65136.1 MAG: four helix bundle protein [Candidatus Shapirobacteria bacterium CG_4_10_14_0_8_um_filter_39_15]PJE67993.1 MAG: four helix bundle protein [Candidatus Shapirobacteria bacterium CG10_big_fil_rev_8_21_14_0_10_38_8]